jgi:hypothetical protein
MSNTEKVKICPTCLLEKSYDDYNKDGSKSNGIDSYCKECKSKLTKEQRIRKKNNMEYETKQQKECGKCNKTLDVANFTKNCYSKDGLKTMCKQCYSSTRKKTKEVSQTYDYTCSIQEKCCRNCLEVKHIDQFPKNRKSQDCHSYICIKCQPQNNHTREKQYQYEKRYYEKPGVKMYRALRNSQNKRIREELLNFGAQKSKRTIQYLGCTIEFLKHWFDFQLARKQLSWDTYGEWEIDHVIPCKSL